MNGYYLSHMTKEVNRIEEIVQRPNPEYHVYKLIDVENEKIKRYVAHEISGNKQFAVMGSKPELATILCEELLTLSPTHYINFSFEPLWEKTLFEGDLYRSQRLGEHEQMAFLKIVRDYVKEWHKE
jgi:hypothetical protein